MADVRIARLFIIIIAGKKSRFFCDTPGVNVKANVFG